MPPAKPTGVKLLITAASLTATLGGWALLSAAEVKPAPAVPVTSLAIRLMPLPTLVPPLTAQTTVIHNSTVPAASSPSGSARPTAAQAAPVAAQPVLRDVSAPPPAAAPAPVVKTRSSR